MPTPSEQKALAFVAIVVLLGGAVRVLRAGSPTGPTELEQQAIARQATAADSAAASAHSAKQGKKARINKSANRSDTLPVVIGGVSSVPPSFARPDRPGAHAPYAAANSINGFPPPSPRFDTYGSGARTDTTLPASSTKKAVAPAASATGAPAALLDMDSAPESAIEKLPGIGPIFAHRIVANRDSLGAFGALGNLRRVKGIGPAKLQKLSALVTFSGRTAPRR